MPSSRTDFELLTSLEVILSFPWTPSLQQGPSPGTLMPMMHSPAGNPLLALSGTFHPVFLLSLWSNRSWAWGQVFFSWLQPHHPPEVSPWDSTLFPLLQLTLLLLPSEVAPTSPYLHLIQLHFHGDTCQSHSRSLCILFQKLQRSQGPQRPCISSKSRLTGVYRTACILWALLASVGFQWGFLLGFLIRPEVGTEGKMSWCFASTLFLQRILSHPLYSWGAWWHLSKDWKRWTAREKVWATRNVSDNPECSDEGEVRQDDTFLKYYKWYCKTITVGNWVRSRVN